jgi:hypothetical protein
LAFDSIGEGGEDCGFNGGNLALEPVILDLGNEIMKKMRGK